ncbi:DUF2076 domain-containing protein [Methylovirgula ligni]|uniref:DUF2076 family protein n=1 Tax=Methylovirgula ligni TaxID=569860 RepID=A0A3D9ZCT6_9HYPH|nr:DUF2076 domain-containing protein [Methylovirgula ligni]QAY95402.1 DUF2076 domain-containing protein [Methylovirgula ligni]REF89276.1 hypothetical protein DES32_0495 [Methylovirgula ligni]
MSPEERQLLNGLFDRIKGSANVPRDPEAEALIANAVRSQPYAPYFLAQAVLVQDQALQAASQRLEELQAQVEALQQGQGQGQQQPASGGFLNSLGSIFGGGPSAAPPPPPRPGQPLPGGPSGGPWGQETQAPRGYAPPQSYPPQGGAPWGSPPPGGGGFLSGALQGAAGVAGGVLLADSIRNLFGGHAGGLGGLGIGGLGGLGGLGTGLGTTAPGLGTGGETIVNNYYDDTGRNDANDANFYDDSSSNSDPGSNDDGSFDV